MKKQGFPPLISTGCKFLILGTLPGEESLAKGQYYGNSRNYFWQLISVYTGPDIVHASYARRIEILKDYNIGVWDVMHQAERNGSLDSNIKHAIINDFSELFQLYPTISHIGFNGKKAHALFVKQVTPSILPLSNMVLHVLPSSSPANAGVSMAVKIDKWLQFFQSGN